LDIIGESVLEHEVLKDLKDEKAEDEE